MKSKKNRWRYWSGVMHLWLGLASGLIIMIIALTGCLYAFQAEIQNLTQPYRFVKAENRPFLKPSQLIAIAENILPQKEVHSVLLAGSDKAAVVTIFHFEPTYYFLVYINPYTGEVLKAKNMDADFFRFVLDGHYYLWLPPAIGQPVVAIATLVFGIILITGIILWWPKNKKAAPQRFKIKWDARWRRKNFDLHSVLGFYACWVAIILVITGLVFGFQWFASSVYTVTGGGKSLDYAEPLSDTLTIPKHSQPAIDVVYASLNKTVKDYETIEMHPPANSSSPIVAVVNPDPATFWQSDYQYYDQYSLKELAVQNLYGRIKDADNADKLLRMNYDIHTGAIKGLPGKILAFFISLIVASLPVTGFLLWLGRKRKQVADNS